MTEASEAEVLFRLFELKIGYEVVLFGSLYVRSLDDGRYAVGYGDGSLNETMNWEELYESPILAIDRFIEARHELQLGLDYER